MRFDTTVDYIRERRNVNIQNILLMSIMFPALMYILFKYKFELEMTAPIIGIMFGLPAFLLLEMIVITIIVMKKTRSLYITLYESVITRINGMKSERIFFSDIKRVQIIYIPSGQLKLIKLKAGRKNIILIGLEHMETVKDFITQRVDPRFVTEKRAKINWYSPVTNFFTFMITMVIIVPLIFFGGSFYEYFNHIFMIGLGLYVIIFKPSSKYYGIRFRAVEVILGCILLVSRAMILFL